MPRLCSNDDCYEYVRECELLGGKALIIGEHDSDRPRTVICFGRNIKPTILRKYGDMYSVRSYDRMPKKYVCLIRTVYSVGGGGSDNDMARAYARDYVQCARER